MSALTKLYVFIDAIGPVVRFEIAKGWLTGSEPELGGMHRLTDPHRPGARG